MDQANTIKVWDIAIRVFHWSLVAAYTIAWLTEDDLMDLHAIAGYTVLGLIIFRVIWGFIGTKHARFNDFVYPLAAIKLYLAGLMCARPPHYSGHNPAGGLMVILLLLSLFAASLSGIKAYGIEGYGPLATNAGLSISASLSPIANAHANGGGAEKSNNEEFWEEVHEFFANLSLLLVFIHIAGVLLSSMLHNENLTKAMVTGRKKIPTPDDD